VAEVHEDLALVFEIVDRPLQLRDLGIREIEGDADDGFLVGTRPLVRQVDRRAKSGEALRGELRVELLDILIQHRAFETQPKIADRARE